MKTHPGSTTCARNLPQHFNGCTCTAAPGGVTAEVDVDLHDLGTGLVSCAPCDEPIEKTERECPSCDGSGYRGPGACASCGGTGRANGGPVVQTTRRECTGCNGTGEYYAKRCTECGGSGRTNADEMVDQVLSGLPSRGPDFQRPLRRSIADDRIANEKRIAADCAHIRGLDDEAFATMLDERLQMFDFHRGYDVRDIHLDQATAETMRDEVRVRKGAEIPGMPGAEERIEHYSKASTYLFALSKVDLGVPQDADEAIGELRRRDSWYRSDEAKDAIDAAVLGFAQADPRCAEAYVSAQDAKIGEIDYFDGNTTEWRARRAQAVMALGASLNPAVRVVAVNKAGGSSPVLDVLATDPDPEVRRAVAERYSDIIHARQMRPENRARGAWDIDLDQHERVLIHDSAFKRDKEGRATVKMLEGLTTDPDTGVRRAAAKSRFFPSKKALKNLATDRDPMVRRTLVEGIEGKVVNEDVIDTLARDPEDGIREALAASGVTLSEKAKKRLAEARTDMGPAQVGQPREYAIVDGKIVPKVARRRR